ncbi:MAG: hypothetical protein K2Y56_02135 [Methylobacterium sp.]|uniref:hypothetical protein n=1 Tax=Methylobacterium sp. TaxID=409 RepID=UPI0025E48FB8|nr:hypothetical protein [Methylobacterium sp.]MBX9930330.1 hypothetical protein [Methylobacterium sp.]
MADRPTTRELVEAEDVTAQCIRDAVETVLAYGGSPVFPIADGYHLDLPAAVKGCDGTAEVLADARVDESVKRVVACCAILDAHPVKVVTEVASAPIPFRRFDLASPQAVGKANG